MTKQFPSYKSQSPIILSIDTSCDETAAAVTRGVVVLSNVIWSQAAAHAQFGGVMPSLAQRMHRERIDFVIDRAISKSQIPITKLSAVAVTAGPGLAIALEVGIAKAKELAGKYQLPLIPVNHIEGHVLSPLARPNITHNPSLNLRGEIKEDDIGLPNLGLVVSGGHTELILINKIGDYKILAKTLDDALGEALDKAARMLGLGYPGGAILEKMAKLGNPKIYPLPLPMARSEVKNSFSFSGLKTAFYRLTQRINRDSSISSGLSSRQIYDLSSAFQNRAFQHLERVIKNVIQNTPLPLFNQRGGSERVFLVGGGVAANMELRKRLRKIGKELGLKILFPYSTKLTGDNAAMIGIAAGLRYNPHNSLFATKYELVDRKPRWSVEEI